MSWTDAFYPEHNAIAREFAQCLYDYADWEVTIQRGRVYSVMDEDGDYIAHRDDYDSDDEMLEMFVDNISSSMYEYLNNKFPLKPKSKVGAKTIMPFPKLKGVHS